MFDNTVMINIIKKQWMYRTEFLQKGIRDENKKKYLTQCMFDDIAMI